MASARTKWIDVDPDGLPKLLERRGKEFAVFELVQNYCTGRPPFDHRIT
jgi:hypothetical protein